MSAFIGVLAAFKGGPLSFYVSILFIRKRIEV